eukprot:3670110-Rhodomonas_salina.1
MQNPNIVEEAVRLDATGVICNLLKLPDDAPGGIECHRQCIQNVAHLRAECTKYNMPLLVEPLAFKWASPEVTLCPSLLHALACRFCPLETSSTKQQHAPSFMYCNPDFLH